jgi:hypothetical protein
MKGSVIIIPADASQPLTQMLAEKQPTLQELHAIVGGYIEVVPHWDDHNGEPCVVYCNEEGKLNELPINDRATLMWWNVLGQRVNDVLVGNVVLLVNLPDNNNDDDEV